MFIVTVGPGAWFKLLASLEFIVNSPEQICTVFLTLLNSCANPVVYLCVLPSYRKDIVNFFRIKIENYSNTELTDTQMISNQSVIIKQPSTPTVSTVSTAIIMDKLDN